MEGEPNIGDTGLGAIMGQSKDGWYAHRPLPLCPKKRTWSTCLFYTLNRMMACAPGNDQLANSAEPSVKWKILKTFNFIHMADCKHIPEKLWNPKLASNVNMSEYWGLALHHRLL